MTQPVTTDLPDDLLTGAGAPRLSRQLGRLFDAAALPPQVREDILAEVPDDATSIADMPEWVQALWVMAVGVIGADDGDAAFG